jgi:hypothetical protein
MPKRRGNLDKQSVMEAAAAGGEGGPSRPTTSATVLVPPGPADGPDYSSNVLVPSGPDRNTPAGGGPKSITVKLDAADYRALLDFCTRQERQTGRPVTHQEVIAMALRRFDQEEEQHISDGDRHSTIVG